MMGVNVDVVFFQLLIFNVVKCYWKLQFDVIVIRYDLNREFLLFVYLGLLVYVEIRKKFLVDKFYRLGLFIFYD